MRTLTFTLVLIAIATPAQADLILAPDSESASFESIYRVSVGGQVGSSTGQVHKMTNIQGSGVLQQNEQIGLFDLSFTRPAHYTSLQVNFTTVEIWHDPQTWTLPLASDTFPPNTNQHLGSIPDDLWSRDSRHKGRYKITGFRGEVVEGTFSLGRVNTGPHSVFWEVTSRDGDPVTGEITGLEGTLNASYETQGINERIFDGEVDGISVRVAFDRQENSLPIRTVPEPNCAVLLPALMTLVCRHRRRASTPRVLN